MDFVTISYLLFTFVLIGFIALYVNKPNLFEVVYYRMSRPAKWLFACSFGLFLFLVTDAISAGAFALIVGVILEKQERFAYIKLRKAA